jgi:hypothetical protein
MNNCTTQVMSYENGKMLYKSGCMQVVPTHPCIRVSKTSWNGVHIRVAQLVS